MPHKFPYVAPVVGSGLTPQSQAGPELWFLMIGPVLLYKCIGICTYLRHGAPVQLELEQRARRRHVEHPHRPARVPGHKVPLLRLEPVGGRRPGRGGVGDTVRPVRGRGELVALGSGYGVPHPVVCCLLAVVFGSRDKRRGGVRVGVSWSSCVTRLPAPRM